MKTESVAFPEPMPRLPHPGQRVRWRNPRHVRVLGMEEAYGHGPFEVVALVDNAALDIPKGIVLKTSRGDREINEVWLELAE
jgi:hypothetical protein